MSPSSVSRTSVSRKATGSACSTNAGRSLWSGTVRVRGYEFNPVARAVVNIDPSNTGFEQTTDLVGAAPIGVSAERFDRS